MLPGLESIGFILCLNLFYWLLLLVLNAFYWILLDFTGFYRVLPSFAEFYLV